MSSFSYMEILFCTYLPLSSKSFRTPKIGLQYSTILKSLCLRFFLDMSTLYWKHILVITVISTEGLMIIHCWYDTVKPIVKFEDVMFLLTNSSTYCFWWWKISGESSSIFTKYVSINVLWTAICFKNVINVSVHLYHILHHELHFNFFSETLAVLAFFVILIPYTTCFHNCNNILLHSSILFKT